MLRYNIHREQFHLKISEQPLLSLPVKYLDFGVYFLDISDTVFMLRFLALWECTGHPYFNYSLLTLYNLPSINVTNYVEKLNEFCGKTGST